MSDLVQGGIFSVMVVKIDDPNDPTFEGRLAEHVSRSLAFFAGAPVIMDLQNCTGLATVDSFQKLRALFKRQHLIPVGVQNANATQVRAAMNADLANFPPSNKTTRRETPVAKPTVEATAPPLQQRQAAPPTGPSAAVAAQGGKTKVVTQPVRSGTQIYARGGDLIVMAPVSAGAEVIADGHVHIYGTLRGRAIAGASGDTTARLFVGKLEAELICIAGHYLVSDAIPAVYRGAHVQVVLAEDRLSLTAV